MYIYYRICLSIWMLSVPREADLYLNKVTGQNRTNIKISQSLLTESSCPVKQKTGMCLSCTPSPPLNSPCGEGLLLYPLISMGALGPFCPHSSACSWTLALGIAAVFDSEPKHGPCPNVWLMSIIRNLKGSMQISHVFCLKMMCFLLQSLSLVTGREFLEP